MMFFPKQASRIGVAVTISVLIHLFLAIPLGGLNTSILCIFALVRSSNLKETLEQSISVLILGIYGCLLIYCMTQLNFEVSKFIWYLLILLFSLFIIYSDCVETDTIFFNRIVLSFLVSAGYYNPIYYQDVISKILSIIAGIISSLTSIYIFKPRRIVAKILALIDQLYNKSLHVIDSIQGDNMRRVHAGDIDKIQFYARTLHNLCDDGVLNFDLSRKHYNNVNNFLILVNDICYFTRNYNYFIFYDEDIGTYIERKCTLFRARLQEERDKCTNFYLHESILEEWDHE